MPAWVAGKTGAMQSGEALTIEVYPLNSLTHEEYSHIKRLTRRSWVSLNQKRKWCCPRPVLPLGEGEESVFRLGVPLPSGSSHPYWRNNGRILNKDIEVNLQCYQHRLQELSWHIKHINLNGWVTRWRGWVDVATRQRHVAVQRLKWRAIQGRGFSDCFPRWELSGYSCYFLWYNRYQPLLLRNEPRGVHPWTLLAQAVILLLFLQCHGTTKPKVKDTGYMKATNIKKITRIDLYHNLCNVARA